MQPELDSKHESDLDPSLPSPTDICLRPRLIPPIRMLFRWLSADPAHDAMETNASPATSPVCGWVVHNRLDESLEIFDATGVSLGSLRVEGTAVAWAPPLGSGQQAGGKFSSVTAARAAIASGTGANANGHVLDLAAALATYESDRFNDFCEQLDAALRATAPPARQHDAAMAPLVSQPLALVRAALRLELSELPAVSQSNSSFDALPDPEDDSKEWDVLPKWDPLSEAPGLGNDSAPTFTARYTRGFEKVTFQARLGDASLDEDGLAWCFTPEGGSSDFNSGGGPGVQIPLTCDPGTTPRDVIVAMLIDPRASVHAATGVVPMKAIDIPPDQYRPAMQKITVSFLATPVLLPPDRVQLPLPGAAHHRWRWLSQSSPGHWDTCTEPRPQASGSQAAAPPPGAGSLIRGVDDRAHLSTSRSAPVRVVEGWLQSEILDEGD
jgi:hypothetical protein